MSNLLSRIKALPKGALIVLVLCSSSFLAGGALVYIGLTVPSTVTVTDPVINTAMFSTSLSSFDFGEVRLNNSTSPLVITVTNISTTTRLLHVSATGLGTGLTLGVFLNDGVTAYAPTNLAPSASIVLRLKITAGASATLGADSFNVVFD